jgi:hypothetical protein
MTDNKPAPHTKQFLLVFHGGMVLYLIGHNVGIPVIRNLGLGNPLYWDVELFWALQLVIFWLFYKYDFDNPKKSPIPLLIYITVYSTLIAILQLISQANATKINVSFFAPTISLASLSIFLIVFFIQFKKYFLWDSSNFFRRHLLAIGLGFAMIVSRNTFLVNPQLKNPTRDIKILPSHEDSGCTGSKVAFTIPLKVALPSNSEILPCGFNFNLLYLNHDDNISVKNSHGHHLHVRLDFLHDGYFLFQRVQVLKNGEVFTFPKVNFMRDGIYRLETPSKPGLGIQIILKGKLKKLEEGDYLITPTILEIKEKEKIEKEHKKKRKEDDES